MRRTALCLACLLAVGGPGRAAEPVSAGFHPAASAAAPARRVARPAAGLPVANFVVEWRLQPAEARPAPHGDVVITSGSATTGASGFGPGAVVVGTARPAVPQALRVANGKEGAIRFDRSQTHTVYDMAFAAEASSRSDAEGGLPAASGAASATLRSSARSRQAEVQSHEVVVHRVDGLRVTPHWTQGDTLELDIVLTHAAPAPLSRDASPGARAGSDIDFHSTVRASFDDWLTVASVGDGGDELQVRVTWR